MIQEAENATEESKSRQVDDLKEMYNYCSNTSKCRRVQVLGHFNERFDEKECKKTCDVCQDTRQLVETDASEPARVVFRFLKAAKRARISIAQGQLASAVRGMGGQQIKNKCGALDGFGEAKGQDGDLIDLLIKDLLARDVLDTLDKQTNPSGFHTAYVEVSQPRLPPSPSSRF
jgi:bloom syndrome protein